jgi:hypothetical protein
MKGTFMKKKLLTTLVIAATVLPFAGATSAHATKAPVGVVFTDGHGGKVGSGDCAGSSATYKKNCQPWAELPAWPSATLQDVDAVGGHFHALFPTTTPFQEISLASESITYNEATCLTGAASGELTVNLGVDKAPVVAVPPIPHNDNRKGTATYDIAYTRLGVVALLTADNQNKAETIVALLNFHAKDTPQNIATRCATNAGGPLKVYFDVAGVVVGA